MPLTQNILQAARTQMAVTLSAKKPLEERQEERWHVDESLMQRAVKNAILEAGINDLYPCSEPRG